jgi:two-component system chemotaxis response regulator CheB
VPPAITTKYPKTTPTSNAKAVVIGSSTGGPSALREIFEALPDQISFPIVVAQHMMSEFLPDFVKGLDRDIKLKVELGEQAMPVKLGNIYIAPGDTNMKVVDDGFGTKRLLLTPSIAILRPSVDILMASVATAYRAGCLGIILTGMGTDGLEGMRAIKAVGGKTIIQDKATSVVYGMAQSVNDEHLADSILALSDIAQAIVNWGAP